MASKYPSSGVDARRLNEECYKGCGVYSRAKNLPQDFAAISPKRL
jgi:hypothetical protein